MNSKIKLIYNTPDDILDKIKYNFIESMKLAKNIFSRHAFRKINKTDNTRYPINKALFEVWSVTLSKLKDKERKILLKKKDKIFDNFFLLIQKDSFFIDAITTSTGEKKRIEYRYSKIHGLIQEVLNYDN
jgi:hypothetical protein